MKITKNLGKIDRLARIILGLGILSLLFILAGNARYWGLAGLVPLLTGLLGFCPLYFPFKFSTKEKE